MKALLNYFSLCLIAISLIACGKGGGGGGSAPGDNFSSCNDCVTAIQAQTSAYFADGNRYNSLSMSLNIEMSPEDKNERDKLVQSQSIYGNSIQTKASGFGTISFSYDTKICDFDFKSGNPLNINGMNSVNLYTQQQMYSTTDYFQEELSLKIEGTDLKLIIAPNSYTYYTSSGNAGAGVQSVYLYGSLSIKDSSGRECL